MKSNGPWQWVNGQLYGYEEKTVIHRQVIRLEVSGNGIRFVCDLEDKILIAAAPDMLEALRKAEVSLMHCRPGYGYDPNALAQVRAAIAKAEGR